MAKSTKASNGTSVNRRRFLKGAGVSAAAGAAMLVGKAQGAEPTRPAAVPPSEAELEAETQAFTRSPKVSAYIVETQRRTIWSMCSGHSTSSTVPRIRGRVSKDCKNPS